MTAVMHGDWCICQSWPCMISSVHVAVWICTWWQSPPSCSLCMTARISFLLVFGAFCCGLFVLWRGWLKEQLHWICTVLQRESINKNHKYQKYVLEHVLSRDFCQWDNQTWSKRECQFTKSWCCCPTPTLPPIRLPVQWIDDPLLSLLPKVDHFCHFVACVRKPYTVLNKALMRGYESKRLQKNK